MAQAADSPIGFHSPAKVPDRSSTLDNDCLAELHAWQASPAGMAEAQVAGLISTVADLKTLARSSLGLRLLAAELPNLALAATEIDQLLGRLDGAREMSR